MNPSNKHTPFLSAIKKLWFFSANINSETQSSNERVWQVGAIYSIYRILISLFLILTNYALKNHFIIRVDIFNGASFVERLTLGFYLFFALALLLVLYFYKKNVERILIVGFVVDMLILSVLLYTGMVSELQIVLLFMVVVAASFMLTRLSAAASITFIAILSLVFQQVFYSFTNKYSFLTLTDALFLSFCLVAVGFLSWSISQRLALAEARVNYDAAEIRRLNAINQEVIHNMVNGVIVIGENDRLLTINDTAKRLLRLSCEQTPAHMNFETLFDIERAIIQQYPRLYEWYHEPNTAKTFELILPASDSARTDKLRINKKSLPKYGQLLIIEDVSREESYAQKLKLASLGQLTASIAHEVRNPLGAISHASQMLMDNINDDNQEMYNIIYNQTVRVNRIIEDIVRLSRQEPPNQIAIDLKDWLPIFLSNHFNNSMIGVSFHGNSQILFDPNHLEQIFINLINNALRHTHHIEGVPDVQITVNDNYYEVLIDVLDNGDGVSQEDLGSLFNPFFTKSAGGTGLGLYLSQAFSEANHAKLRYLPNKPKTCFRLICISAAML